MNILMRRRSDHRGRQDDRLPDELTAQKARAEAAEQALARISEACRHAAAGDLEFRIIGVAEDDPALPVFDDINRLLDLSDAFVR